jgi:hypothetical protein
LRVKVLWYQSIKENLMTEPKLVVKPTLGNKISYYAKAVASFLTATVTLVVAVLATVPDGAIPNEWAVWVAVGVGYVTSAVVWLTTNGPKIGDTIDLFGTSVEVLKNDVRGPVRPPEGE